MSQTTLRALFHEVEEATGQRTGRVTPKSHQQQPTTTTDDFDSMFGEFIGRSPAKGKDKNKKDTLRNDKTKPLSPRENKPRTVSSKASQLQKQPGSLQLKENSNPTTAASVTPTTKRVKHTTNTKHNKTNKGIEIRAVLETPAEIPTHKRKPKVTQVRNKNSRSLGVKEILRHAELSSQPNNQDAASGFEEKLPVTRVRAAKSRSISSADLEYFEQEEARRAKRVEELKQSAVVPTKQDLMRSADDVRVGREAERSSTTRRRRRSQSVDLTPTKKEEGGPSKRRHKRRNSLKRGFLFAKELFTSTKEGEELEENVEKGKEKEKEGEEHKGGEKEMPPSEGKEGVVKEKEVEEEPKLPAGTMNAIVGYLIEENMNEKGTIVNNTLLIQFLLAYRQWMTPQELFNTLLERYHFPSNSTPLKRKTRDLQQERKCALPTRQKIVTFLEEWIKVSYDVDFKPNAELVNRVIQFLNKRITRDGISGRGHESNKKIWTESSNATKEKALECLTPVKEKKKTKQIPRLEVTPTTSIAPTDTLPMEDTPPCVSTPRPTATSTPRALYSTPSKKSTTPTTTPATSAGVGGSRIQASAASSASSSSKRKGSRIQELKAPEAPPSPHSPTAFSKKLGLGMKSLDVKDFTSVNFSKIRLSTLAEQLSRIDFGFFQKIKTTEFNRLAFSKSNKEVDSPNVTAISIRFNQISYWVATQIVIGTQDRLKTVARFIKLCKKLYKLGNFASLFAVVAGLELHSVSRLKNVWNHLGNHKKELHEYFKHFVDPHKNYLRYRTEFKKRYDKLQNFWEITKEDTKKAIANKKGFPLIPFLGMLTRDFTFADAGNPDYLSGSNTRTGIVNPEKIYAWGSYLIILKNLQAQVCHIKANYPVDNYLTNLSFYSDEVLDSNVQIGSMLGRN